MCQLFLCCLSCLISTLIHRAKVKNTYKGTSNKKLLKKTSKSRFSDFKYYIKILLNQKSNKKRPPKFLKGKKLHILRLEIKRWPKTDHWKVGILIQNNIWISKRNNNLNNSHQIFKESNIDIRSPQIKVIENQPPSPPRWYFSLPYRYLFGILGTYLGQKAHIRV